MQPNHHTPQPFYGPFSGTTRMSQCQKTSGWCKGRLTEADTPTIRLGHHSIWTKQCPSPPDALPAAQPTVSKHWRQHFKTSSI